MEGNSYKRSSLHASCTQVGERVRYFCCSRCSNRHVYWIAAKPAMANIYESGRASHCAAIVYGDIRFFYRGDLPRHLFIHLGEIQEAFDSFAFVDSSRTGVFGFCIFYYFTECIYEYAAGLYVEERGICGIQAVSGDVQSGNSDQSISCACLFLYRKCGFACWYSGL
ncbi:hypothetical protein D3C76_931360 [compost metagenome]